MTIVLLDLEETVIDDIKSSTILVERCKQIREVLETIAPSSVGVFSWALWSEDEAAAFWESCLRSRIEDHLGIELEQSYVWSMEGVRNTIASITSSKHLLVEDLFDMFGKEECLNLLFRKGYFTENVVLIDDTVSHRLTVEHNGLILVYLNAKELRDK